MKTLVDFLPFAALIVFGGWIASNLNGGETMIVVVALLLVGACQQTKARRHD